MLVLINTVNIKRAVPFVKTFLTITEHTKKVLLDVYILVIAYNIVACVAIYLGSKYECMLGNKYTLYIKIYTNYFKDWGLT